MRATEILRTTAKFTDGHYETGLLWRHDDVKLPSNRREAETRLSSLKRKFRREPELETKYRTTMEGYIAKGHARKLSPEEASKVGPRTWYLPHFAVTNENKPGKVRIVFDAAAEHHGTSLNKNLLQGPDSTNSLAGVLMRFREDIVAVVADIESMFHQVRVRDKDQDSLRFLWWGENTEEPPDEYVMTVHIFGAADSPCSANSMLKKTADDNEKDFDPVTVETEGLTFTKFMSNNRQVLAKIPSEKRAMPALNLDLDDLPVDRALGMRWNIEGDTFGFKVSDRNKPDTMRGVLSTISSVFDPLNIAAPIILPAKRIMQTLWRQKHSWDQELSGEVLRSWQKWKNNLPLLETANIPRCYFTRADHEDAMLQLHHFCDASEDGYGTVTYLRTEYPDGFIKCSFVTGKSKTAPIKSVSIPRLELQGALLAARVDHAVRNELRSFHFEEVVFWTDSMITLNYINNESRRFKTYVANRITEIRELTNPDQWRHCPGKLNPADDVSRGLEMEEFLKNERWINGPAFLAGHADKWPENKYVAMSEDGLEAKKEVYTTNLETVTTVADLINNSSSWTPVLRKVAWLLKFLNCMDQEQIIEEDE
ncbi:hypothetical protein QZH41_019603 [Actinostola sp. cb2023]|nr:hypothetical protein QZH41_019603 [Actinostola sp. cb2023]